MFSPAHPPRREPWQGPRPVGWSTPGKLVLFADADGPRAGSSAWRRRSRRGVASAPGCTTSACSERKALPADHRADFPWPRGGNDPGVEDTQCRFKCSAAVARSLRACASSSADVEVLMMAQRRGYRIAEVPVNWFQPGSGQSRHRFRPHAADLFVIRGATWAASTTPPPGALGNPALESAPSHQLTPPGGAATPVRRADGLPRGQLHNRAGLVAIQELRQSRHRIPPRRGRAGLDGARPYTWSR
jgi:hypothetical protein